MIQPIKISLVNLSTVYKDSDLPILANGLSIQVNRDLFAAWGIGAQIFYTPSGQHASADHWGLYLMDDAQQAGELGVHDTTATAQPLGQVFVKTTLADGEKVQVPASHELCEILCDPEINLSAEVDNGQSAIEYAFENCDAVENDEYSITIPVGWAGAGQSVPVSNFVTRAWFQTNAPPPYDWLGKLTKPLQLSPGGYISFRDLNNLQAGWQQNTARTDARGRVQARPHVGSRRMRRMMPRADWIRSTYTPGTSAVLAGVPVKRIN